MCSAILPSTVLSVESQTIREIANHEHLTENLKHSFFVTFFHLCYTPQRGSVFARTSSDTVQGVCATALVASYARLKSESAGVYVEKWLFYNRQVTLIIIIITITAMRLHICNEAPYIEPPQSRRLI